MLFTTLGSSSKGNGYLLHNQQEALVLEAGIRFSSAKKALDFNTRIIKAVLVSHVHGDHSKYVQSYPEAGITVLADQSVIDTINPKYLYLCKAVIPGKGYKAGNFRILPFSVNHDVPCLGYLINHPETGNILFLTDTFFCEYTFPDLRQVIIEANYEDHILESNIQNGYVHPSMRPRLMETHLELETCKGILLANDLSKVSNIVLVHLSDGNSNEDLFIREIQKATGKLAFAAKYGLQLDFSINPY